MNVLITSGGTSEKIDNVRRITNSSTGRLGYAIAEGFSVREEVDKIWYVCGYKAFRPERQNVENITAEGAEDLLRIVSDLCETQKIDVVVHAMAVSDYSVRLVTTVEGISASIAAELGDPGGSDRDAMRIDTGREQESLNERLLKAVSNAPSILRGSKISSNLDDLVLLLQKTPKVISTFRKKLPHAILIGFKLLDSVTREFLIDTAYELLLQNDCDFVLANDLHEIGEARHMGYLIDRNKQYETFATKKEIAGGIVNAVLASRRGIHV